MDNITSDLKKKYVPKSAIIVYEQNNSNQFYLEARSIKKDGRMGPAKPVSRDFITGMVETFRCKEEKKPHGIIPENMLAADSRFGNENYIWWTPPGKRKLFFTDMIAIPDGDYNMPGCLYHVKENKLSVFAFKGQRPNRKTKLLFGPFFNYYHNGDICLGNAQAEWPEDIRWSDILHHWEKLFWASINSHSMLNPMKDNYNLAVEIKNSAAKPFDTSLLQETGETLESYLYKHGN